MTSSAASSFTLTPLHHCYKSKSWCCFGGQQYSVRPLNNASGRVNLRCSDSNNRLSPRRLQLTNFATTDSQTSLDIFESENSKTETDECSLDCRGVSFHNKRGVGKPGFISFHGTGYYGKEEDIGPSVNRERTKVVWFVGPTVLVSFLVFPSLYLRNILSSVFEDSLLRDFLILFVTEALFYSGVAIFVFLVDYAWKPIKKVSRSNTNGSETWNFFRISSVATLVFNLIVPLLTMGLVWPWTGPAASATLAPYLVGIVVQFAFEQYARSQNSPAWAVIPIIFQVYRLHQLNRAAQLVTALSFSVRDAEITPQTIAINNSLGTLLVVLQILGMICIWSFSSFLMRFLPLQGVPES